MILPAVLAASEPFSQIGFAADAPQQTKTIYPKPKVAGTVYFDIPYTSSKENDSQSLDIFMPLKPPDNGHKSPLVVFIHGGGWYQGDKRYCTRALDLRNRGYAVANINYRLTEEGRYKFPAQIYDCKAAIRWLRSHADKYGYDGSKIGVWGTSAGGHLAALLGTTSNTKSLSGSLGDDTQISDAVQAVVDWYGPSDLMAFDENHLGPVAKQAVDGLIGGLPSQHTELAKEASPVTYVSKNAPPFLIMHGEKDQLVPPTQSRELFEKLKATGVDAQLVLIPGMGHEWFGEPYVAQVQNFLDKELLQ